jgi:hypothetical protein
MGLCAYLYEVKTYLKAVEAKKIHRLVQRGLFCIAPFEALFGFKCSVFSVLSLIQNSL